MMDLDNYIETQSRILTSETLALQTIRNSGLAASPELSGWWFLPKPSLLVVSRTKKVPPEIAAFLGSLSVKRIPNTRLMEVTYESTDPVQAARILNAHLDNYKKLNMEGHYEATTEATTWLQDNWRTSSAKWKNPKMTASTTNGRIRSGAVDDKQNMTTQRLLDLNKELTDAESETLKKRALYEFAESGALDAVPQIRDNAGSAGHAKEASGSFRPVH